MCFLAWYFPLAPVAGEVHGVPQRFSAPPSHRALHASLPSIRGTLLDPQPSFLLPTIRHAEATGGIAREETLSLTHAFFKAKYNNM
jgi:hypothetical protein